MKKRTLFTATLCASLFAVSGFANTAPIEALDLDALDVGVKIVGPVGPDVEVSLIDEFGNSVGDLRSSVACPVSFSVCTPPSNPQGTIYTYTHTVTPGVDNPNDPPFPNPPVVLPFDDVNGFSLGFEALGFNGVAGYSFSEAQNAEAMFEIELTPSGELIWSTTTDDWDTGEAITFFWQTTQAPSGPGGSYNISNGSGTASGNGPLPSALPVPVSAPFAASLFLISVVGLGWRKRALK